MGCRTFLIFWESGMSGEGEFMNYLVRATTNLGDYVNILCWEGDGEPNRLSLRRFVMQDMAQTFGVCPVIEGMRLERLSDR